MCQFRVRGWDVSHLIWPEVSRPLLLPLDPSCFLSDSGAHSFEILLRSKSVPSALMFICGSPAGEPRRVPRPATLLGNVFPPFPLSWMLIEEICPPPPPPAFSLQCGMIQLSFLPLSYYSVTLSYFSGFVLPVSL